MLKSKVGEKVSLPCCYEIPSSESLHKYRVYWQKNVTDVVLAYSEGNMISQHERYQNRTEMDPWNLTLWISPVEILDNGSYQCVVQRNSALVCSESVILLVTGGCIDTWHLRHTVPASGAEGCSSKLIHTVADRLSSGSLKEC